MSENIVKQKNGLSGDFTSDAVQKNRVVSIIREQILSGEREPGSRLNERVLSEEFGLSRLPVREALRQLIKEGLVVRNPREFAHVKAQTLADVAYLREICYALDTLAVRLSTQRHSEGDLINLRRAIERYKELDGAKPSRENVKATLGIAHALYQATHSPLLNELFDVLSSRVAQSFAPTSFESIRGADWDHFYQLIVDGKAEEAIEFYHGLAERASDASRQNLFADGVNDTKELYEQSYADVRKRGGIVPTSAVKEGADPEHLQIVQKIAQRIVEGKIKPGELLSERELANQFGLSRMPARQALEDLASQGLVYPGSRRVPATVRGLTRSDVEDYLEVIYELDRLMFKNAAARWDQKDLYILSLRLDAEVKKLGNQQELRNALFAFRSQIYKMTHNSVGIELNQLLENRYRAIVAWHPAPNEIVRLHKLLFGAIEARDEGLTLEVFDRLFEYVHPTRIAVLPDDLEDRGEAEDSTVGADSTPAND